MPLPNRITPFGQLETTAERGQFFGNRGGRFHDPATQTVRNRPWASRQWIICLCDFKGRRDMRKSAGRTVWDGSRYTELFFCDEVTALAAGHRPCMECRRSDAMAYRKAVLAGGAFTAMPSCPELDRKLDAERRAGHSKRLHAIAFDILPDGAMVALDDRAFAVRGRHLLSWSHGGYFAARPRLSGVAQCLTPPTSLAALAGGFKPTWHPGADGLPK